MRKLIFLTFLLVSAHLGANAQPRTLQSPATEIVLPSPAVAGDAPVATASPAAEPTQSPVPVTLPAGTPIEVEAAHTVSSRYVREGESLSFRVLIPVTVNGRVAIEQGALVTARVTKAKRGGRWGKAGKLNWTMQDVVAVDNVRVPLAPETRLTIDDSIKNSGNVKNGVTGDSHGKEVATRTIVMAALIPPLAPLALIHGFKRGENAVLEEGRRFVVAVKSDFVVSVAPKK